MRTRFAALFALSAVFGFVIPAMAEDAQQDANTNGRAFSAPPLTLESKHVRPTVSAIRDGIGGSRLDSGEQPPNRVNYFVHPEDVSIQGSNCVGLDCTSGEAFGFDTIRMKENNTRIKFADTSTPGGTFPYYNWQLTANDSDNGGLDYFAVDNITTGTRPLGLRGDARNNAIYARGSRVGFGTDNPSVALHVLQGDTPGLRLDQQGGGYPAFIWDVSGNETNFFIRHFQGGETLPFKILPAPPTNSMVIAGSGNVGLGLINPGAKLHLSGSSPTMRCTNTSGGSTTTFDLDDSGNLTLSGLLLESSSREVKENLVPVNGDDVLERVAGLGLYRWNYKASDPADSHVGPTAEDFSATFGLGRDDKHVSAIDLSGVALSAVQALERQSREKDERISALEGEIERLSRELKDLAERVDSK